MLTTFSVLVDLVIIALALNSLLVLWYHEESFLSEWRVTTELWEGFLGRLLNCKLCLSYQAPFWLLLLPFYLPAKLLDDTLWSLLLMLPVYSLAVTSLFWVISGVLRSLQPYFYVRREEESSHHEPTRVDGAIPLASRASPESSDGG